MPRFYNSPMWSSGSIRWSAGRLSGAQTQPEYCMRCHMLFIIYHTCVNIRTRMCNLLIIAHEYSQTHRVRYLATARNQFAFFKVFCTNRITHELTTVTVCVIISHRKQLIRVGCLLRITHILFTRIVCVLLAHRKQFIYVNCMPHITHILLS